MDYSKDNIYIQEGDIKHFMTILINLQPTTMIGLEGDNNKQHKYDQYISRIDKLKKMFVKFLINLNSSLFTH